MIVGLDGRSSIGYHLSMPETTTQPTVPGSLLLQARLRAHLSQRELARRSGTSQSTIAAYERGTKGPRFETLMRLLRAAGFDLRLRLETHDDHDDSLDAWRESLSQDELNALRHRRTKFVHQAQKSLRSP